MERIGLTDQPESNKHIALAAARGEYEPFQIGIRASHGSLTHVQVSVSDLSGPHDHKISSKNVTLYREHYIYVAHPSPNLGGTNQPLGKGWYADGLIPLTNSMIGDHYSEAALHKTAFHIDADRTQPIWVDLFVPRDTPAGQYQGTFTVTSDQGNQSGKISLRVWDFELPLKPSLHSCFLVWEHQTKSAMVELLKHKLMPSSGIALKDERELIDTWGLKSVRLPFWSGADVDNGQMTPAPSVKEIQAKAALHQPDLFKYVYSVDEINSFPHLFETVKQWGRAIHQAGTAHLAVMAPVPELYDDGTGTGRSAVDIWVVLPKMYEESTDRISEVLRKGDHVWSYNSLVQDSYSPKWQIDFAPINFRIQPGFISQSLGLTGLLYWRVDLWTQDPWKNIHTFFDRHDKNRPYPGDGMLVYPGQQVGVAGVLPSMRLKWLREGIEDYEYIAILKRLGQADQALEISRSVGRNWQHWTKKTSVLEHARHQLGEAIEKTYKLKHRPQEL